MYSCIHEGWNPSKRSKYPGKPCLEGSSHLQNLLLRKCHVERINWSLKCNTFKDDVGYYTSIRTCMGDLSMRVVRPGLCGEASCLRETYLCTPNPQRKNLRSGKLGVWPRWILFCLRGANFPPIKESPRSSWPGILGRKDSYYADHPGQSSQIRRARFHGEVLKSQRLVASLDVPVGFWSSELRSPSVVRSELLKTDRGPFPPKRNRRCS